MLYGANEPLVALMEQYRIIPLGKLFGKATVHRRTKMSLEDMMLNDKNFTQKSTRFYEKANVVITSRERL